MRERTVVFIENGFVLRGDLFARDIAGGGVLWREGLAGRGIERAD